MIVLIGESGSGKTTILNELEKKGFQKAIDYTTRSRRQDDVMATEYRFISKKEFEQLWQEGKLLQRAVYNNEFYGLSAEAIQEENTCCIQIVDSIVDIKAKLQELGITNKRIVVFYIYVPAEERTKRMLARGDSIDKIQERLALDKEKFKDAKKVSDYIIENKILEEAVAQIITLAK